MSERKTTLIALRVHEDLLDRIDSASGPVSRASFCRRLVNEGLERAAGRPVPKVIIESGVLSDGNGRAVVVVGRLADGRLNLFDPRNETVYAGVDVELRGYLPEQGVA